MIRQVTHNITFRQNSLQQNIIIRHDNGINMFFFNMLVESATLFSELARATVFPLTRSIAATCITPSDPFNGANRFAITFLI
jgi:hypothetical protein